MKESPQGFNPTPKEQTTKNWRKWDKYLPLGRVHQLLIQSHHMVNSENTPTSSIIQTKIAVLIYLEIGM